MKITFDPNKAATNFRKHGIRFSDAESVLIDPMALTREDRDTEGEQRFTSIGVDATGRLLVVVFSYRGEEIRLISAPGNREREGVL